MTVEGAEGDVRERERECESHSKHPLYLPLWIDQVWSGQETTRGDVFDTIKDDGCRIRVLDGEVKHRQSPVGPSHDR